MDQKTAEFVELVKKSIEDKQGFDIEAIDVKDLTSLADVFVIASGSSDRTVQAIADNIEDNATKLGIEPIGREGRQGGRWILLDYNQVVIHIFHQEERNFYNLERLWSDGRKV